MNILVIIVMTIGTIASLIGWVLLISGRNDIIHRPQVFHDIGVAKMKYAFVFFVIGMIVFALKFVVWG